MEEYIRPVMEVIGIPKENTIITSCDPYHSCGETDYSCSGTDYSCGETDYSCGTDCATDCWGGYHPCGEDECEYDDICSSAYTP